ncbi:NAD(P)-binding protein [Ceratobasidium sp. AG-I]|nr:NAD(P)-binding protein [Ceratobasidium sp. AG-I]
MGKPIVAVCGATGFQGGSTVRHLLQDGRFAVRALTRKPESAHAKELAKAGATVVKADFDDQASLCRAFKGCYGVFGVTDYFEAFDNEYQQGVNIIDAAKSTGVKHLVFSSAPDADYDVPTFKHKAAAAKYMRASGVPYTILQTSFYYSNVFLFEVLSRHPRTGGWQLKFPFPTDARIPCVSPRDVGAFVLGALVSPSEWIGKKLYACTEFISPRQIAETFAEVTGSPLEINETTREEFLALENAPQSIPGLTAFKWFLEQDDLPVHSVNNEFAAQLCPNRQTWRDYATEHMEVPPSHPVMIQCFCTNERFL